MNILTRNSAATLDAALRSVGRFAELLICDGGSTDATLSIAREHGCVVYRQDERYTDDRGRLRDYAGARSQLVEASRCNWILYLDSDEVLTPAAAEAIAGAIDSRSSDGVAAFRMRAEHLVDGFRVTDGIGYPMRMERLFRRSALQGFSGFINEQAKLASGARVEDLDAVFLIPLPPLRRVLRKWGRYLVVLMNEANQCGPSWTSREVAVRRSAVRWSVRWWLEVRSRAEPHRMPARYEAARVGFAIAQYLVLLGARTSQRWDSPS